MCPDAPDWVRRTEVVVIVENEPVEPVAANETAAGDAGRYSGTDQTYQTVASWTVATDKVGELKEILLLSSLPENTEWKITIAGAVWETDLIVQAPIPLVFEDLKLAEAVVVLVEAQSTDGTSITVDAIITGKEIG